MPASMAATSSGSSGRRSSTPDTSPTNTAWSWRMESAMGPYPLANGLSRSLPRMRADPFAFFDVIYCINLDRRPDRWRDARAEFEALGIAERVERVPAVDLSRPQLGCCLSHIDCARRATAAGAATALV